MEDDVNHRPAREFLAKIAKGAFGVPVTTDYVLDETLTLLRSRRSLAAALSFVDKVRNSKSVRIFWIEEGPFEKGLQLFRKSDRQSWSFTDCTSFALMKDLSLVDAFSFDSHFQEAGFRTSP